MVPGHRRATILAHVTDAHIAPNGRRNAVLKDLSVPILEDLVAQANERGADAVLFGGDNIDNRYDGKNDIDAFIQIASKLDRWLCVPGNHEAKALVPGTGQISKADFAMAVAGHGIGPSTDCFSEVVGNVRVIGIDTTLIGSGGGHVSDTTMRFLAGELRHADEDHIVVLGHHLLDRPWAPFRLDVWDDEYLVANREQVTSLLATNPRVRAYLCGHHHAARIGRIGGRGESGGFYHILTPSPAAYPCFGRLLRFEADRVVVEPLQPRIEGVLDEAAEAVLGGRKARRFSTLGSTWAFAEYLRGRLCDASAVLPHTGDVEALDLPPTVRSAV